MRPLLKILIVFASILFILLIIILLVVNNIDFQGKEDEKKKPVQVETKSELPRFTGDDVPTVGMTVEEISDSITRWLPLMVLFGIIGIISSVWIKMKDFK